MQVRSIISGFIIVCLVIVTFFCNAAEGGKLLERTNQKNNHRRENSVFVQRLKRRAANTYRRRRQDSDSSYVPMSFARSLSRTEQQPSFNPGPSVLDTNNAKIVDGIPTISLGQTNFKRQGSQYFLANTRNEDPLAQRSPEPIDNAYPDEGTGDAAVQSVGKPPQVFDESAQPPRQWSDESQQNSLNSPPDSQSANTLNLNPALAESLANQALEEQLASTSSQLSETIAPPEDDPANFASA